MNQEKKGQLKIFFSYAKGIGKTHAMLKAGQIAKSQGLDVLVGYIAPHTSDQIMNLVNSFKQLDSKHMLSFDLDEALRIKPDLILIDELAHSNCNNSRHRKRYQDVEELLKAGIDVYTTVNVGNIESLHDTVAAITGINTWDHIPDYVFDTADQVELIDIEPQVLMERLSETEIADSKLTLEQMTALREVAFRRCADRVKILSDKLNEKNSFHTDEHILVCLSSSPSNAKIIRTAARMARAFNSQFTALFVETPEFAVATEENKRRLDNHHRLAEQLGANIETVYGDDIPYQISEFARLSGITKIVLGSSSITRKHIFGKPTITEQLLSYAPEIDIHIIPDMSAETAYRPKKSKIKMKNTVLQNALKSFVILFGATILSILFDHLGFTDANIIMVYILGVLLTSIATSHQIYSLVSSIASVFIFNFLFTTPRFSLLAYETGYPVTFVIMFLTAYITGTFAMRYKEQAAQSAKVAHRTKILFDTDQLLSKANGKEEIISAAAEQVMKLLERNIVIFENLEGKLSKPVFFYANNSLNESYEMQTEIVAAEWVIKNNHVAGATTDTHSNAKYLYFSLRVSERVYGVMGIQVESDPLDAYDHSILLSILGETALALENEKNSREKEEAAILVESEQLRANLLRTISHDLRTPLTTISGNASNLINYGNSFNEETKQQIYHDIYDDSIWLIDLVENLLYATRIEEGRMTLHTSQELLSEIIDEAMQHVSRKTNNHSLFVSCSDELMLVNVDAKLVVQVITNIIDNAIKYTNPGTSITVIAHKNKNMAEISISDTGSGIPDEMKEKIFEKFYCGNHEIADNRRSLGLGLYLCKVIIEAHGGTISVADNHPQGAVFTFTLPLEEILRYE